MNDKILSPAEVLNESGSEMTKQVAPQFRDDQTKVKPQKPRAEKNSVEAAVDRILNQPQLAGLLNIKIGTLYSHMSRKVDLPPSFKVGSQTRWRESVVWKWIEAKEKDKRRSNFED